MQTFHKENIQGICAPG